MSSRYSCLGDGVARRAQVAAPGALLVADRAELPDAERRVVRGRRAATARRPASSLARLRPDGLPELVLVAPRRDEQEVEALAAAVQDDEAELAGERARAADRVERLARQRRHSRGDRPLALGDLVPLEQPAAGLDGGAGWTTFETCRSRP